ncbi:BatA domain-containing protein [Roseimaritima sediminicola]|uniref:BatA domain-containing protein n=1 Tax=Roseimaritima sediminicola TaxID=2662066 RepID=UPI00138748C8|nr:BatA domain-containing protein [Roseimaritima sediminicola]
MTFLNGALAFGALAFAIPLLIHLLNRSRFQTVDWGAMHLLESVIRVNQRRFQLQQWVLLAIRCAIPVLLALALAIPVLTDWRALPQNTPSSLVAVIDDSYSMAARYDGDGEPLIETATAGLRKLISALPRGSQAQLIASGVRPLAMPSRPTVDLNHVDNQLRALRAEAGPQNVLDALQAATVAAAGMDHARREIVLVSDFQRADWNNLDPQRLAGLRRQWQDLPVAPAVTLIPVGNRETGTLAPNVSVQSLEPDRATVGMDQTVRLRATIHNHADEPRTAVRVRLHVDGEMVSATTTNLEPRASRQVLLTHAFERAGSHVCEVALEVTDTLPADDRRQVVVDVLETINVLLVDGRPSHQPLQGETGFLSVALSPFAFGRQDLADLVNTRTVGREDLNAETLADVQVVVLANVNRFSDEQVQQLERFVAAGNSLLIFTGNRVDVDWYNDRLGPAGAGLLPMTLGERSGTGPPAGNAGPANDASGTSKSARLAAQFFEHPAMQLFNETSGGALADADIYYWHPLQAFEGAPVPSETGQPDQPGEPGETGVPRPAATLVARLETGQPLIAESAHGDGVVLLVGTSASLRWSNLPMQPSFVPLIQEWINWMATRGMPPRNVDVGHSAVVLLPGDAERTWQWIGPEGKRTEVPAPADPQRHRFQSPPLRHRGVYTLAGRVQESAAPDQVVYVAAAATAAESQLVRLSDTEIARVADQLGATVSPSVQEYLNADSLRRYGREIWRPLLGLLLVFMLLEVFLQQRFAGVH